jgi:hypothetical protein
MRTLAATLMILAFMASPALAITHKASGFGIDPPFPFSAEPFDYPGATAAFGIVSFGKPTPVGNDRYVCRITFSTENVTPGKLTQEGINQVFASDAYRQHVIANAASLFELETLTTFDEQGMTGLEMIGTPKGREDAADVRLVISVFETPAIRVSMSCATTADQIDSAVDTFRTLRHTIIVPTSTE